MRFAWFLGGTILPIVCFLAGSSIFGRGSGSMSGFAGRLLSLDGSLPLMPLLFICMGSVAVLALWPGYVRNGWVRLGVFSGVVLSLEYWFVFQIAFYGADSWSSVLAAFVSGATWSVVSIGVAWLFGRMTVFVVNLVRKGSYGCTAAAVALLAFLVIVILTLPLSLLIAAALCGYCSTPWALAVYVSATVWLIRRRRVKALQFTLWQLFAATTWFAIHLAAWRTAMLMILRQNG